MCIAVWFRGWELGRIPGVNGDEAWYGVATEKILDRGCVSARTPTGNVINPFFMRAQIALHAFLEPSFTVLRMPALASGLLALLVNFVLCYRAFGWRMAWLTTLVHAVLPINIAYSRFAWDASQSLLFTLPVIYAGVLANQERELRRRWTVVGLFGLAAALLAHPTNLFVAPFWALISAAAWSDYLAVIVAIACRSANCHPIDSACVCCFDFALDSHAWPRTSAPNRTTRHSPSTLADCSVAPAFTSTSPAH